MNHTPAPAAASGSFITRFFRAHPLGFWFFFWGEFAERGSYYGMLTILPRYMSEQLQMGDQDATTVMHLFMAGVYFLPLLGGYIADNHLGKYWTIVGFSLPYIMGHVILGIENYACLVIAMTLLAMGSGVIKPNISTLMGQTYDEQRPGQTQLRTDAFAMFYFAINVGAVISQLAVPVIRDSFKSYWLAFLFPAGLMVIAFAIFAAGKKHYAQPVIAHRHVTPEERTEQIRVLGRIIGLFLLVMFFWAVFDQSHSTWVFFARDYMHCTIFGREIAPDAIQAFNPVFIMVLLPLANLMFKALDQRGWSIRATDKMLVGFLLTAGTMAVMAWTGLIASPEAKVSVWWQIAAFLVLTMAEVLISVTGLELAYAAAPKTMTGFVTACWLLTVSLANLLINAPLGRFYKLMSPASYFGMLTLIMLVVSVAFYFVARRFNQSAVEHGN